MNKRSLIVSFSLISRDDVQSAAKFKKVKPYKTNRSLFAKVAHWRRKSQFFGRFGLIKLDYA